METRLKKLHGNIGPDWDAVLRTGALLPGVTWSEAELAGATQKLQEFQSFCDLACEHMITLVTEVAKAREGVVLELVSQTRVVVATMDAYCKYKAGRLQSVARGVLDNLRTKLALLDEWPGRNRSVGRWPGRNRRLRNRGVLRRLAPAS